MSKDRAEMLGDIFEDILGSKNVYLQAPPNNKMKYPCIIFSIAGIDEQFGDNVPFIKTNRWSATLIDKNPRSPYVDVISDLPYSSFDRHYNKDGLNHFVFDIYF